MTEKLAGLMRQALDAGGSALAPVSQELRLVQDYLEIEKTRFGERLRYSVEAPEQMSDAEVPPLALQTLVENSVKYAVAPRREGGEICVNARMEGDCAVLEVSDDGPGFEASALKPDHGLQNLRERLAALLDVAGSLEIARRERRMVVTVRVPQGKGRPA